MKILFLSLSGLTFDVTTPEKQPLGGTESSFCYLARELAKTHEVTLVAKNCPSAKQTVMGVYHDNECNAGEFDVVISNAPMQFTGDGKKPYSIFWNHLAHFDNAIKSLLFPDVMIGIDCIVYVSEWQKNECEKWFGKAKRTVVIGNGLTPCFENMFANKEELVAAKDHARAVYTSTPFRGLRMLPEIMEKVNTKTKTYAPCDSGYGVVDDYAEDVKLEVYSGLSVYQGNDVAYEGLYRSLRRPDIAHGGNVSQTALAERLKATSYMLYPCVFPETYCISVLEAMAAGLEVITTNLAALPSTLAGHGWMVEHVDGVPVDEFINKFVSLFQMARSYRDDDYAARKFAQVLYVNQNCTWAVRSKAWNGLLGSIAYEKTFEA